MNIKRSYFQVLAAVGVGMLLMTNCTVKEGDDDDCDKGDRETGCKCSDGSVSYQVCNSDGEFGKCVCDGSSVDDSCDEGSKKSGCSCSGNVVGYQVCDGDGVYGACVCPSSGTGGSGNDTGGTNSSGSGGTGNASNGGSSGSGTAAANAGGAGGEPSLPDFDPENCEACLQVLCAEEFQACLDDKDPNGIGQPCISEDGESGQYVDIANCINAERVNGLVKRDVVRNCGVTIGASATDASLSDAWAPQGMRDSTTNLLNCMATSSQDTPNADWANSDDNFPVDSDLNVNPTPWPDDSCAKLACTSKFQ
jgi:hypothetical protein